MWQAGIQGQVTGTGATCASSPASSLTRSTDEYKKREAEGLLPWSSMVGSPVVIAGLALLLALLQSTAEEVQEFTSLWGSI